MIQPLQVVDLLATLNLLTHTGTVQASIIITVKEVVAPRQLSGAAKNTPKNFRHSSRLDQTVDGKRAGTTGSVVLAELLYCK